MPEIYIKKRKPLTDAELEMVRKLDDTPVTFDEDSTESTPQMLKAFEEAARERDSSKYKDVSPNTTTLQALDDDATDRNISGPFNSISSLMDDLNA